MIRLIFSLLSLLLIWNVVLSQNDQPRVLFIGNSYTASNNLPQIFRDFSLAAGKETQVDANSPGGTTFQYHASNALTNSLINQGDWDYVVLQEQSQLPSFPINQVEADCFPYAETLNETIEAANPCGETVFFMTWGRKNGDASNCASWPPICTYQGMDSLLYERYMQMTIDNDAIVSPVGAVWHFIRENFSNIELYSGDESHPSPEGSYAAACTFYSIIHRADPTNVVWDYTVNPLVAMQIRFSVKSVVFDSLSKWMVGEYDTTTVANFDYAQSGLNATFNNTSINSTSSFWSFGDGDTSSQTHPSHLYPDTGTYDVQLVSSYCDSSDTVIQTLIFEFPQDTTIDNDTTSAIGIRAKDQIFRLYPNPTSGMVTIQTASKEPYSVRVINQLGQVVLELPFTKQSRFALDLSHLSPGVYSVAVMNAEASEVKTLVLN